MPHIAHSLHHAPRRLVSGALLAAATLAMSFTPAHAVAIPVVAQYCGPVTTQQESTSTRGSKISLQACLDVTTSGTTTRKISVRPALKWSNAISGLTMTAVDFNAINLGGSLSTPTICPTLPAWTQPNLSIVNAADNFGWSTTNNYSASETGSYVFVARATYDVKDDGLPARTLYATVSRTIA